MMKPPLRAAAYMISEIIMPCCCMLCNKSQINGDFKADQALSWPADINEDYS